MSIHMYIGPMYAGKTTRLIEMYNKQKSLNKIVIDYNIDEGTVPCNITNSHMVSHDNVMLHNVYKTKYLFSLKNKDNYSMFSEDVVEYYFEMFQNANHIYINECQFFGDLKQFCLQMVSYGKTVYLYGLDSDFKQEKFGEVFDLIPFASTLEKIHGKCQHCENESIISHRISTDENQYLPDENAYIPLCLSCYGIEG